MKPGQKIFNLLKSAKGQHVPVSHIVAVVKLEAKDVMDLCSRLVSIGKASCRYERNGFEYEPHFWVEVAKKK